jgi:hypothetical protein
MTSINFLDTGVFVPIVKSIKIEIPLISFKPICIAVLDGNKRSILNTS